MGAAATPVHTRKHCGRTVLSAASVRAVPLAALAAAVRAVPEVRVGPRVARGPR